MSSLKTVKGHQQFALELHGLVEVSQEVSVMNMQQVRQSVLLNRSYMDGIINIFTDVRRSHQKQIQQILDAHKTQQKKGAVPKKPAVAILLSPSGKFSGPLVKKVFEDFAAHLSANHADVAVVGDTGRGLIEQQLTQKVQFEYFSINLDRPSNEELAQLLTFVLQYESITVFSGRFQSLAIQQAMAFNISGFESLKKSNDGGDTQEKVDVERSFLFEPELDQIATFFEAQVIAALFRQTVDESKLANLGSRIMTLESSLQGINQEIGILNKKFRRAQRHQENRKQFNRISGMRMW